MPSGAELGLVTVTTMVPVVPTCTLVKSTGFGEKPSATPVPLNPIVCGLAGSELVTVMEAVREPIALGWNCTLKLQVWLTLSVDPQVLWETMKSPAFAPVSDSLSPVIVLPPMFLRVTVCEALVVLTIWLANDSELGEIDSALMPVPLNVTDVVAALNALLLMVSVPLYTWTAVGVNVTLIVHCPPAARLAPQVLAETAKPLLVVIAPKTSGAVPVLDTVTD